MQVLLFANNGGKKKVHDARKNRKKHVKFGLLYDLQGRFQNIIVHLFLL